jgi:hypothetical protein
MMWVRLQNDNSLEFRNAVTTEGGSAGSSYAAISGGKIADGKWHHFVYTYADRIERVYVDGKLNTSRTLSTDMNLKATDTFQIADVTYPYEGGLDDFQLYNREITADEVQAFYARLDVAEDADPASALPVPVAHWSFDDADNMCKDSSGNDYDLSVAEGSVSYATPDGVYGGAACTTNGYLSVPYFCTFSIRQHRVHGSYRVMRTVDTSDAAVITWGDTSATKSFFAAGIAQTLHYPFATVTATGKTYPVSDVFNSKLTQRSGWMHVVFAYDPDAGKMRCYRDGVLSGSWDASNYALDASGLFVGDRKDTTGRFKGYIDDLRVYAQRFLHQVVTLSRSLETGTIGSTLPTNGAVSVSSGATLAVSGTSHAVGTLSGAGTLSVEPLSRLTVKAMSSFSGSVTGSGTLRTDGTMSLGGDGSEFWALLSRRTVL